MEAIDNIFATMKKKDRINACIDAGSLDNLFLKYRKEKNYFQMQKILADHALKLSPGTLSTLSRRMWQFISYNVELSEDLIRQFADKVDWDNISWSQNLSENFIREFSDKVNWDYISYRQVLSKDFIREFYDRLNWECIFGSRVLSKDFMREFSDKIDWTMIRVGYLPNASEFIKQYFES